MGVRSRLVRMDRSPLRPLSPLMQASPAASVTCVTAIVRRRARAASHRRARLRARAPTCRRCSTPCTGARRRSWRWPRARPARPRSSARSARAYRPRCSPAPATPTAATRDAALADWLADRGARLVVLAGYMELLGAAFLARFPGAVINVHPSLLPAFPGWRAIEQALAYGVKVFGVTVHFVDARRGHRAGDPAGGRGAARRRATRPRCSRRCARSSTRCSPRGRPARGGAARRRPENPRRIMGPRRRDRLWT